MYLYSPPLKSNLRFAPIRISKVYIKLFVEVPTFQKPGEIEVCKSYLRELLVIEL